MLKNALWMIVVITAVLIQTTWLKHISYRGVRPDLTVLLVVYFALTEGEERAMFTGVLGGMVQEVASNVVLGQHVLCLVVVGYAVGRLSTRLVSEHPAVKCGLVFVASLIHGTLYLTVVCIQKPENAGLHAFVAQVIPGAFYTAISTPIVFWLTDRILRRFRAAQGGATLC